MSEIGIPTPLPAGMPPNGVDLGASPFGTPGAMAFHHTLATTPATDTRFQVVQGADAGASTNGRDPSLFERTTRATPPGEVGPSEAAGLFADRAGSLFSSAPTPSGAVPNAATAVREAALQPGAGGMLPGTAAGSSFGAVPQSAQRLDGRTTGVTGADEARRIGAEASIRQANTAVAPAGPFESGARIGGGDGLSNAIDRALRPLETFDTNLTKGTGLDRLSPETPEQKFYVDFMDGAMEAATERFNLEVTLQIYGGVKKTFDNVWQKLTQ